MNLKGNGNGNGHLSPNLKIALFMVVIVLVGVLLYRQIGRMAGPRRAVLVAASELAEGSIVGPESFEEKQVRENRIPEGAITDRSAIEGQRTTRAKAAGAPFVASDFVRATGKRDVGSISWLVPEGRVLMTLRVNARQVPYPEMRRGDRMNILAVYPGGQSGTVASDTYLIGQIASARNGAGSGNGDRSRIFGIDLRPPGTRSRSDGKIYLLLALYPQHVFPVAQAQAAGAEIGLVVHGRTEVQEGKLLDLAVPHPTQVELIAGENRENVALKP